MCPLIPPDLRNPRVICAFALGKLSRDPLTPGRLPAVPAGRLTGGQSGLAVCGQGERLAVCGQGERLAADIHLAVGHEPGQCLVEGVQ